MLVFCHAHIDVEPGWLDVIGNVMDVKGAAAVTPAFRALDHHNPLSRHDALRAAMSLVAPNQPMCGRTFCTLSATCWMPTHSQPFEAPFLSGACWAVRTQAFSRVGGYEAAFRGYGGEEEEISLKLWLNGYTVYGAPRTCVSHQYRTAPPPPIHLGDVLHNRFDTALCHYNQQRVERLRREHRHVPLAEAAYAQVFTEEIIQTVRSQRFAVRVRDDDWFFAHFGLNL